jgi:xanthine dehydrogenase YagS FAD-binding subunit
MKQRIVEPSRLVSLKNLQSLKEIKVEDHQIRIGAMASLADLAGHPVVGEHFPSIVTAVKNIGSPQMIHHGTVGGDLCQRPRCWYYRNGSGLFARDGDTSLVRIGDNRYHAIFGNDGPALFVHPSSLGPVMIALGASILATGPEGKQRSVLASEFFQVPKAENERETVLRSNEILTEIQVPLGGLRNATYEVRHRHGFDWPYVTATAAFRLEGGLARDTRIVLGHVAPVPWPVPDAAKVLNGVAVDGMAASRCGEAATKGAKPLSRNGYKTQLVKVAVKRAVEAAEGV